MILKCIYTILFTLFLYSCSGKTDNHSFKEGNESSRSRDDDDEEQDEEEYSDGEWCADVEYYNANTGTRNTYTLDVEVESGELVRIAWPSGGWLDESHFIAEDISSGECSFTSDRGYEYSVKLNEKGGCGFTDGYRFRRDIENDIRKNTCPKCGEKKYSYDDMCDDCQQKVETCPKCFGYKFDWERICESCKSEMERRNEENNGKDY